MRGTKRVAAAVLGAALLGSSSAGASISLDLTPVDNSAVLTGYVTYDLDVTTDADWTAAAGLLTLSAGSIYQDAYGVDTGPPNPAWISLFPTLAFDTYVAGNTAGAAGDVGGDGYAFNTSELDVTWYNLIPDEVGTTTIARLTLTDDATGSLLIMLTTAGNQKAQFTVGIDAGVAQAAMPVIEESSSLSGAGWETELSYVNPWASPVMPGEVDTRTFTPSKYSYFTDKPILDRPTVRPPRVSVATVGDLSTTPEPGTLALIGACLGLVMLKRR